MIIKSQPFAGFWKNKMGKLGADTLMEENATKSKEKGWRGKKKTPIQKK